MTEKDRKLLMLAAKAIDKPLQLALGSARGDEDFFGEDGKCWNPLEDDGDALRLAVKLRMDVDIYDHAPGTSVSAIAQVALAAGVTEDVKQDDCAATRRAITHAAAQVGKAMP